MPASSTPQARGVRARLASAPRLVDGCLLGYADIGTSELVVQLKYHDKHEILILIQDGACLRGDPRELRKNFDLR